MRRLLTALLFVLLGLVGLPTTTVSAAAFTYDVCAIARVDVHGLDATEASPAHFGVAREVPASPSVEALRASTTPYARSVAIVTASAELESS